MILSLDSRFVLSPDQSSTNVSGANSVNLWSSLFVIRSPPLWIILPCNVYLPWISRILQAGPVNSHFPSGFAVDPCSCTAACKLSLGNKVRQSYGSPLISWLVSSYSLSLLGVQFLEYCFYIFCPFEGVVILDRKVNPTPLTLSWSEAEVLDSFIFIFLLLFIFILSLK